MLKILSALALLFLTGVSPVQAEDFYATYRAEHQLGRFYSADLNNLCESEEMMENLLRIYVADQTAEVRKIIVAQSDMPEVRKTEFLAKTVIEELNFSEIEARGREQQGREKPYCKANFTIHALMHIKTTSPLGDFFAAASYARGGGWSFGDFDQKLWDINILGVKDIGVVGASHYDWMRKRSYPSVVVSETDVKSPLEIEITRTEIPSPGFYVLPKLAVFPIADLSDQVAQLSIMDREKIDLRSHISRIGKWVIAYDSRPADYVFPARKFELRNQDDIQKYLQTNFAYTQRTEKSPTGVSGPWQAYLDLATLTSTRAGRVSFTVAGPMLAIMAFNGISQNDCEFIIDTYDYWLNSLFVYPDFDKSFECSSGVNRMSWRLVPQMPFYVDK